MDKRGRTHRTKKSLSKRQKSDNDSSYEDPSYKPTSKKITQQPEIYIENDDILKGLEVDGNYVKVDENLIKRLRNSEVPSEIIKSNPFENFPDFAEILRDGTPLTMNLIEKYSKKCNRNYEGMKMADLLGNYPIEFLAMKYSEMKSENWDYNIKVSNPPKISNQEAAGLCWLHAATNVLRYDIMKKFQVDHRFELSQSYLFFYDKVERSNLFLENLWQSRHRDIRDFKVHLMADPDSNGIISDGGMYSFFSNLANKYGIVPKNVYGGSLNCRSSQTMNDMIMRILLRMMLPLFREGRDWSRKQFETYKDKCMSTIYDVVVRFLGEPPKPTDTFDWTYKDVHEETHTIKNLTPEKFYRIIVPHDDTKITIIHDPRHPETEYISSWVEYGLNMHGQMPTSMINLPLKSFKKVIAESLKNDEAVWFACDIHNGFDVENKTWDTKRFDYERILGTPIEFDKADMLDTLASRAVHAMAIGGVDTVEDANGETVEYKKWRIYNSWGSADSDEAEMDSGFYRMSDEYFDRYVTIAVVDLKYFEPEEAKLILKNAQEGKNFTYKFTDAFGSVARSCSHCKSRK